MKQFSVTGMTCAACSAHVEKAVKAVPGVTGVTVSLLTNSMTVEGSATPQDIISAVEKAGYGASTGEAAPTSGNADLSDHETPKLKKRLIASLILLLPLMYVSMGHVMWGWPLPGFFNDNPIAIGLVELIFAVAVMVVNQKFFISGSTSLIHGAPNMDTLVALGSGASLIYSLYALFAMTAAVHPEHYLHEFYFESAAMILALITVGKMLEARSKGKTTDALKHLMALRPKTARLLVNGEEQIVPMEQLVAGDLFAVRSGDAIPVDGVVLEGEAALDESALTGESIPVDKEPGNKVSAATICRSGYLTCRATRVGQDTTLSQIIKMVTDAAATKAPIAKIADKVSGIFVPVVISIALVTTLIWLLSGQTVGYALARGISVLVISCPCALGLATPVAIMVGSGKGAGNGILFKTAASLEAAGRIQIVALDKTGTLTHGTPQVTDILPAHGFSETELLTLAYSLEKKSEHPLGRAVVEYGQAQNLALEQADNFKVFPGGGLSATLRGDTVSGGNRKFITTKAAIPSALISKADALAEQGKTPLFFARGKEILGIIAVADTLKPQAKEAISQLHGMGIEVVMLTGDNAKTAAAIAKDAGIDDVIADVLPGGKEAKIRSLQQRGTVAMVGDGINDAPALTRADVGIAIGAGTDVALDAADVVLVKSDLLDIPAAVRLSRRVLKNIHENLFWAFIYNIIGIPLAAGLYIPLLGLELSPMFGAAAMSLSSFCVVSNALRLNLVDVKSTKRDRKGKAPLPREEIMIEEEPNMTTVISIEGMMCPRCVAHVDKALKAVPGVETVEVSLENNNATVTGSADKEALSAAVTEAGYDVTGIA